MYDYIKSDVYRVYGRADFSTVLSAFFQDATLRFQIVLRIKQKGRGFWKLAGKVLWRLNKTKKSIQISPETQIGYGLYIGHGGPMVVNPTAVIGNNCNLSQFLTIGSNHGQAAVLGNNVYIGPSVCLVEAVRVGDNATIGAGSVVTKDIPENATAVGNYAKVIHYKNPGQYIHNPWPLP